MQNLLLLEVMWQKSSSKDTYVHSKELYSMHESRDSLMENIQNNHLSLLKNLLPAWETS